MKGTQRGEYGDGSDPARWAGGRLWRVALVWLVLILPTGGRAQGKFITEYRLDREVVEIPFEYVEHQIVLKGQVSGRKDLTLLFDCGAVSPVLDTTLGLRGPHLADTQIQEAEGASTAEAIWLDDIRLGPENGAVHVINIPALLTDLSQISRVLGIHVDGIVGISFMAGYVVEIDYQKHLLRFHSVQDYSLAQVKPDNQRTFLFDLRLANPHKLISTVVLNGLLHPSYDYDFLLDTGFGGYASIAHLAAEESGMIHADTPRVAGTSYGVSHSFRSEKIRAPFMMLGEINLSGKIVSVDYRNKDVIGQTGIIGNRFLQNYHLTLDYRRHKLLLERATTTEEEDEASRPSFGIVIRADSKTVRVYDVKRNSPAQRSGIRVGDILLMLNGQPVDKMTTAEVANLLASGQRAMRFQLRRGIDPNLGTGGDEYELALTPTSPFDWLAGQSERPDQPDRPN